MEQKYNFKSKLNLRLITFGRGLGSPLKDVSVTKDKSKWRYDHRSCGHNLIKLQVKYKLERKWKKNKQNKTKWGFNGIETHGLSCVGTALLYQLSYKVPYFCRGPTFLSLSLTHESLKLSSFQVIIN